MKHVMHENWCLIEKMYHITTFLEEFNNPIQNEPFRGCSHMGGQGAKSPPPSPPRHLPKICHEYPAEWNLAQLYLA